MPLTLEQSGLDDGLVDALFVLRQRHEHTEFAADRFRLTQDDIEDKSIHRIILSVEHGATHFLGLLAEAIHAAFALFVAGRVPCEVVVDHSGETVLEIDAFRKAIGGDENWLIGLSESMNAEFAFIWRVFPGDGVHRGLSEMLFELGGDVVGRRDIAAEDDRAENLLRAVCEDA